MYVYPRKKKLTVTRPQDLVLSKVLISSDYADQIGHHLLTETERDNLIVLLHALRQLLKDDRISKMFVNNIFRSEELNNLIPGAVDDSFHKQGRAADVNLIDPNGNVYGTVEGAQILESTGLFWRVLDYDHDPSVNHDHVVCFPPSPKRLEAAHKDPYSYGEEQLRLPPAPEPNRAYLSRILKEAQEEGLLSHFRRAAEEYDIELSVLLAISAHESGLGTQLDDAGTGDFGHGRGLMQIDDRWHGEFVASHDNLDHPANIEYGAQLFRDEIDRYDGALVPALAAYNTGSVDVDKAIGEGKDPDYYTTPSINAREAGEPAETYSGRILRSALVINEILDLGEDLGYVYPPTDYRTQAEKQNVMNTITPTLRDMPGDSTMDSLKVEGGSEDHDLVGLKPPEEGELDVGDLRFGSVSVRALDESHRNQVTAMTQQNAGAVGVVDLLRTDTEAVVADNRVLPEVVATITVNATIRDDVNRILRPLVAMQRHFPFLPVRNADVSRLMLGIGSTTDLRERLRTTHPEYSDAEIEEMASAIEENNPGSLWVPASVRAVNVQSQPGAPDLYQVHLVLRYANILPYVPEMRFWKRTKDAVEWAGYQAVRSIQGTDVLSYDPDTGEAEVAHGDELRRVRPPAEMGEKQTTDPYESYVFKKFYRSLLEEYQQEEGGGPLGYVRRRGSGPLRYASDGNTLISHAYPLDDPDRLFERYDPEQSIGLYYQSVSNEATRASRRSRLIAAFEENRQFTEALEGAYELGAATGAIDRLKDLGKISPLIVGPGYKLGIIASSFEQQMSFMQRTLPQIREQETHFFETYGAPARTRHYYYEAGEAELSEKASLFTGDEDFVVARDLISQGGLLDFQVPDGEYQEIFIPFTEQLSKIQGAILATYAEKLEQAWAPYPESLSDVIEDVSGNPDGGYVSPLNQYVWQQASELRKNLQGTGDLEQALRRHLLTFDFISGFIDALESTGKELHATIAQELRALFDAARKLSGGIAAALQANRGAAERNLDESSESMRGFLDLSAGATEGIQLRFSGKYADRQWDGYPHPVSQHLGGKGAEVSLSITTNSLLLLDQLGELKEAQIALGELRKQRDVVPNLIDVYGPGNILRSFGIKKLAYRSHTISGVEDKPGYYRVTLELIQDEDTLTSTEKWTNLSGTSEDQRIMDSAKPLLEPTTGDLPTPPGSPLASTTWDVGAYGILSAFHNLPDVSRTSLKEDRGPQVYQRSNYSFIRDILTNRAATHVQAQYRPPDHEERSNGALRAKVIYQDGEGERDGYEYIDATSLAPRMVALLDYAHEQDDQAPYRVLKQRVEVALSSTATSGGYLLTLYRVAASLALAFENEDEAPRRAWPRALVLTGLNVPQLTRSLDLLGSVWEATFEHDRNRREELRSEEILDNVSFFYREAAKLEDASLAARLGAMGFYQVADILTGLFAARTDVRDLYLQWLEDSSDTLVDVPDVKALVEETAAAYKQAETLAPNCYQDLLVKKVRDEEGQLHLIGYDFPFGPGQDKLTDNAYLEDYRFAENMRKLHALNAATVGLEGFTEIVGDEAEKLNMDSFAEIYDTALAEMDDYLSEQNASVGGGTEPFKSMMRELEEEGVFHPGRLVSRQQLTPSSWLRVLQITKTVEFVMALTERARGELEGYVSEDGSALSTKVTDILDDLAASKAPGLAPTTELSSLTESFSNIDSISGDPHLIRRRDELLRLYAVKDPETVAGMLGYSDPSSEPWRAELQEKMRNRWSGPVGMRKAFPSYQLLLVGPVGSSLVKRLGDVYSYTAVQSIEIRKQKKSASQSCDLVLSNLRGKLGYAGGTEFLQGGYENGLTFELSEGQHMHVYLGYGPDVRQLYPFAGRITAVRPGPITTVTVTSYSASLNNAPNQGRGFQISGSDGQFTLADSLLYTISQTAGLEGLGRGELSGTMDRLGRTDRGFAQDDFRVSLMAALYRGAGSPGLGELVGSENESDIRRFLSLMGEHGQRRMEELLQGNARLFENLWVVTGRERYGWVNEALGGLKDWWTGGKGWGWAALPGESSWAQIQDHALLYPDYIATTRPYNLGLPPGMAGDYPLRQTLYFGPKHGHYVHTAAPHVQSSNYARLTDAELTRILATSQGYEDSAQGDEEVAANTALRGIYKDFFFNRFLRQAILRVAQHGESAFEDLEERPYQFFAQPLQNSFRGAMATGEDQSRIEEYEIPPRGMRALHNYIGEFFPNTLRAHEEILLPTLNERIGIENDTAAAVVEWAIEKLTLDIGDIDVSPDASTFLTHARVFLESFDITDTYDMPGRAIQDVLLPDVFYDEATKSRLLQEFAKDLEHLAQNAKRWGNLQESTLANANPIFAAIQEKLREKGYTPEANMKPVVEHHFCNTYEHITTNEIEATSDHPEFANRINLQFPKDPDDRLAAYLGQKGTAASYPAQANPLIHDQYISERTVYFPNVRQAQYDEAGTLTDLLQSYGGDKDSFKELVEARQEVVEAEDNGQDQTTITIDGQEQTVDVTEGLDITERAITRTVDKLAGTLHLKPKYQTVATNILRESMQKMYSGSLVMHGSPHLEPYHVLHVYDDVELMHGPVEVGGVYHSFSSEGFYTAVQPELVCSLRGIDPTLDVLTIGYMGYFSSMSAFISRAGQGILGTGSFAGRGMLYSFLLNGLAKFGVKGLTAGTAFGGPVGWAVLAADAIYSLASFASEGYQDKLQRYVGILGEAADANPLVMAPLTYRGEAYVAGLTGATGPATLRAAAVDALDRRKDDPTAVGRFVTEYLSSPGPS